ncbi:hypothetical protein F2P56_002846, partial [Juglans regia]
KRERERENPISKRKVNVKVGGKLNEYSGQITEGSAISFLRSQNAEKKAQQDPTPDRRQGRARRSPQTCPSRRHHCRRRSHWSSHSSPSARPPLQRPFRPPPHRPFLPII